MKVVGLNPSTVFLKCAYPGLFLIYFRLFEHRLQFLQKINVKNVHPVYGTGIQTHNLWNMSLLPKPLDQGSRSNIVPALLMDGHFHANSLKKLSSLSEKDRK